MFGILRPTLSIDKGENGVWQKRVEFHEVRRSIEKGRKKSTKFQDKLYRLLG